MHCTVQVSRVLGEGGAEDPGNSSLLSLPARVVRESSALLRLYTALRGVAGMKFTEEEVRRSVQYSVVL